MMTRLNLKLGQIFCAAAALTMANSAASASGAPAICRTYSPVQSISSVIGSKSTQGYFVRQDGACSVVMMVAENFAPDGPIGPSAARLRVVLRPGQSAGLDSEEGRSLKIECGSDAQALYVTTGSREEVLPSQNSLCLQNATK